MVEKESEARKTPVKGRKLYYISAEFLIGKLLSNNLINLGLYDPVKAALEAAGKKCLISREVEPEPSLGNGGLGRLAACFLDSLATFKSSGETVLAFGIIMACSISLFKAACRMNCLIHGFQSIAGQRKQTRFIR